MEEEDLQDPPNHAPLEKVGGRQSRGRKGKGREGRRLKKAKAKGRKRRSLQQWSGCGGSEQERFSAAKQNVAPSSPEVQEVPVFKETRSNGAE